jgi:probable HAF family extracellular repeat protein
LNNARRFSTVAILLATFAAYGRAQNYTAIDLGAFRNASLNNHGQVAGWAYLSNHETFAVLYTGGALINLGAAQWEMLQRRKRHQRQRPSGGFLQYLRSGRSIDPRFSV